MGRVSGVFALFFMSLVANGVQEKLDIVVIMPGMFVEKNQYPINLNMTLPGIDIAVQSERVHGYLPNYELAVDYTDSECSLTIGPVRAMEFVMRKSVHVFLGPVCDYAAAPVARYTRYWDIPMLSAGTMSDHFGRKDEFFLVRMMSSYSHMKTTLADILEYYHFKHVAMLTDDDIMDQNRRICALQLNAIWTELYDVRGYPEPYFQDFDQYYLTQEDYKLMLLDASKHARGEYILL
ncbi:atrial natriuretic peptide receptor 3-like [Saccoglossus kowalevskii]